jgi:hypothetical protein
MVGMDCHWGGKSSKPCWSSVTGGLLKCPRCGETADKSVQLEPRKLRWIGYVPMVSQAKKREVVIVSETVGPRVKQLPVGCPVKFMRTAGKRDPLQIAVLRGKSMGDSYDELGAPPKFSHSIHGEDITEWLLDLWDEPELSKFFKAKVGASELEHVATGTNGHKNDYQTQQPGADPVDLHKVIGEYSDEERRKADALLRGVLDAARFGELPSGVNVEGEMPENGKRRKKKPS